MMGGFPVFFFFPFAFVFVFGIATTIWRMRMARNMAARAGLDQNAAGAISMLSPNGLDATYLAASLATRPQYPAAYPPQVPPQYPAPPATQPKTAEQRLLELVELKDKGLITEAEFLQRREQILGSI